MSIKDLKRPNFQVMRTANIIAISSIVFFFGIMVLLLFFEIPNGNRDIFNFLLGSLCNSLLTGIAFAFFGYHAEKTADKLEIKQENNSTQN